MNSNSNTPNHTPDSKINTLKSQFCTFGPQILINIGPEKKNNISKEELLIKLTLLEEIDSDTFFSGEIGKPIDNGGMHLWFIENYYDIMEISNSDDQDIAASAKKIIETLYIIITQSLPKNEQLNTFSIKPIKELIEGGDTKSFMHGFELMDTESGEESILFNIRKYNEDEIAKILQNN